MLVLKLSKFATKQFYIVLVIAFLSAMIETVTYFLILFLTERLGIIEIKAFEGFASIPTRWLIILTSATVILRFVMPALQQFWLHHFYAKFSNNFAKRFIENNFTNNEDEHVYFITLMTTKLKPIVNSFFLGFVGLVNSTCIIFAYLTTLICMGVIDLISVSYFVISFIILIIPLSKIVSYCSIIIRNNMNIQARFVDNLWKNLHQIILLKQLQTYLDKHQSNEYAIRRADQTNQYLAQFFKIVVDAALLITLLYLVLEDDSVDVDNLLVSIITLQRVLPYFSQMQNYYVTHRSAYGIAKEYEIGEKLPEDTKDLLYRSETDSFKQFSINDGYYSWTPGSKVHVTNFKINRGLKIGLTGRSGVGKSTFIKSLLGLNEFLHGDVHINSKPVSYPFLGAYKVSYLNQEGDLLTGTVLDNLGITDLTNDEGYMLSISKLLKDLDLPHSNQFYGLQIQKLSGGQQQRVRVLSAAISNCDVVVFDEATSSLDKGSVQKILEILKSASFRDKTVIFISHDASVLDQMDMIYEIDSTAIFLHRPQSNQLHFEE